MNNAKRHLIAACLILLPPTSLWAQNLKIITNPNIKAERISARAIRDIFLENVNMLGETRVEPVLAKSGLAHETLLREYLGKSDSALESYYRALVFTGRGSMPKSIASDAEIVAYVAKTRNTIAYVSADASTEGVRTLQIEESERGGERRLLTRIEPEYPETLKKLQIGGTVRLKITIAPQGNVKIAEVVGGNPVLAECALKAVRQWVYAASSSSTTTQVTISFDPQH